MTVEEAARIVHALGDEHAEAGETGEAVGAKGVARHVGVPYFELRQHAHDQGVRLERAVVGGVSTPAAVVRLAYMAGFFAGAIWRADA
jgi:hypothetical protein